MCSLLCVTPFFLVMPALAQSQEHEHAEHGIESCDGADLVAGNYERWIHDGRMEDAWTLLTEADRAAVDADPEIADRDPTKFWRPDEWKIEAHCLSLDGDAAVVRVHRLRGEGDYRIDHMMTREKGAWRVNWGYAHFELARTALKEGPRLEAEDRHVEALAYYERVLAVVEQSTQDSYELETAAERLRKKIAGGGLARSKSYRSKVVLSGLAHDKELQSVSGFLENTGRETLSRVMVQTVCKDGSSRSHEVVFVTSHDVATAADLTYGNDPDFGRALAPGEVRPFDLGYQDHLTGLPCELDRVQVQDVDFTEDTSEPHYAAAAKRARAQGLALREYGKKNVRASASFAGSKIVVRVENRGARTITWMDLQLVCKPASPTGLLPARPAYLPEAIGPGGARVFDATWIPAGCRQPSVRATVRKLD